MAASVELRLLLDNFKRDAQRAGGELKKELDKAAGGTTGAPVAGGFSKSFLSRNPGLADLISRGQSGQGFNPGMFAKGIAAGMFSPWIGARLINQSGIGGAGGGGGMIGALFGSGGLGGFGAAYIGLQLASRLLKAAFDSLRNSVTEAAQLFFQSARLHQAPGDVMARSTILKALGVENPGEFLQRLQYQRGSLSGGQIARIAGLGGQQGGADYVASFVNRDKQFWDEMANSSREFHVLWTTFAYQLQRLSSTLASEFLPAFNSLLVVVNRLGPAVNALAEYQAKLFNILNRFTLVNIFSGSAFDFSKNGVFGDRTKTPGSFGTSLRWNQIHMSEFERMGFAIGRGGLGTVNEDIRQTAANTLETNNILTALLNTGIKVAFSSGLPALP